MIIFRLVCFLVFVALSSWGQGPAEIYQTSCKNCHGEEGQGIFPAIPPLKNSDFFKNNPVKAMKAVLEGLSGKITVNGHEYNAVMPAVPLDDENVAKVLNYVSTKFNGLKASLTAEDVRKVRLTTKYPTYKKQLAEIYNIGLPKPPEGWQVKLGVELDFNPTRILDVGHNKLAILAKFGDVYIFDLLTRKLTKVLLGKDYLSRGSKYVGVTKGIAIDKQRRLYITNDYVDRDKNLPFDLDRVSIFRTESLPETIQKISPPKPWYQTEIPAGVGPYNHGISHIEQGPDDWMYVSFGSRTNAGETGDMARRAKSREHELSAAIWRLKDTGDKAPLFEVYARGFRNPYSFTWDKEGRLFASENGPDKDIATELNLVEQGKHYGFPYAFADLASNPHEESPKYDGTESFVKPLKNLGPAGITPLVGTQKPMSTFTAHCVPVGMTYVGANFPKNMNGTMLLCRFGGFWPVNGITTGFDILQIKYNGDNTISSSTFMSNLARPVDVTTAKVNKQPIIVIAEYCRGRTIAEGLTHPGRILILEQKE
ncbi:MAG: PQQ-dependent sugar dehydrogenase [Lentisphaeraceae bacterium]|nr:PQQ-dependent sugar dehydrogenase [Lentisphaeraceae bacterium]